MLRTKASWRPAETAVIICDMWDKHWCKGATRRVGEMAPAINDFITAARSRGVLIVHAPSDCMKYYADYPGRKAAMQYKSEQDTALDAWRDKAGKEGRLQWPIDSVTQGCSDAPYCVTATVWTKEHDAIGIDDKDLISDSGSELAAVFKHRGIRNVMILGVHENMCVVGRSFGIRSLTQQGYRVALVRDLTDAMYDPRQWPFRSHFGGVALMTEYIETNLCPTILSSDITGKTPFRFAGDDRKM